MWAPSLKSALHVAQWVRCTEAFCDAYMDVHGETIIRATRVHTCGVNELQVTFINSMAIRSGSWCYANRCLVIYLIDFRFLTSTWNPPSALTWSTSVDFRMSLHKQVCCKVPDMIGSMQGRHIQNPSILLTGNIRTEEQRWNRVIVNRVEDLLVTWNCLPTILEQCSLGHG